MDRLIGALAVLLMAAVALPSVAALAEQLVPALGLALICLVAIRIWLSGFG